MANLLEEISDFFFGLFNGDQEALKARRELRHVTEILKESKPPLYNRSENQILPGFPESWWVLYRSLLPLNELFQKTIGNPDQGLQDHFFSFLLESYLVGDITQKRLKFSYNSLKERLESASDPDKELKKINGEFLDLVSLLKRQRKPQINEDLMELMKLKNLALHDFSSLFLRFGLDLAKGFPEKPRFPALDGDRVIQELLDLYYVLGKVNLSPLTENSLYLLLEKLSPGKLQENRKVFQKLFYRIQSLLRGPCSPHLLVNLIQAVKRDPFYHPEAAQAETDHYNLYLESLQEQFDRDRDRAHREIRESQLSQDIQSLFGKAQILELEHYRQARGEEFNLMGLEDLVYARPMAMMNSFLLSTVQTLLMPSLNEIITNGFFVEKSFSSSLGDAYFNLEKVLPHIKEFDSSLALPEKGAFVLVAKHMDQKPVQKSHLAAANRIIVKVNDKARTLLEASSAALQKAVNFSSQILQDYKKPSPELITNVKTLGGPHHRSIIQNLLESHNHSVQFLKVMKHFIIIKGQGKPPG